MNNQDNQAVLNGTSQDTKQPETVVPDTDSQTTSVTSQVTDPDTTQEVDSSQSTNPSAPTAPTVPENVKLNLTTEQADMVQDLLSNFVYAYRSDREVDCKRELVRRDQVGKYPYVAEAPDPSIINPTYDWINKKWYSKNNAESLPEIAKSVADLNKKSAEYDQSQQASAMQTEMLTKQIGKLNKTNENVMKTMMAMQSILQGLALPKTTPTVPTADTKPATDNDAQDTKPATQDETNNGGNN